MIARQFSIGFSTWPITKISTGAFCDEIEPAFGRTSKLEICLTDIPTVLVWQRTRNVLIEKDSGVLRFPEESEPTGGLKR
jgi:hypothetical protein